MKKFLNTVTAVLLLVSAATAVSAEREGLLMVRSTKPFEATLDQLSATIGYHEYKISRIQRVDVGLTKTGFKTEKYRLVFYGKTEEIEKLAAEYPQLIPFIPLKIVIFSEGKDTILLAMNPHQLRKLVPEKKLFPYFDRWEADLKKILSGAKD